MLNRTISQGTSRWEGIPTPLGGGHALTIVWAHALNNSLDTQPSWDALAGLLKCAPVGDFFLSSGTFSSINRSNSVTWRGNIGRNDLSDLNLNSYMLGFFATHSLSIKNTMFEPRPQNDGWLCSKEKQCGFLAGCRALYQPFTLTRVLEGAWEFAQPVKCLVDLEKTFDAVPWCTLWEVLCKYGIGGPYKKRASIWFGLLGQTFWGGIWISSVLPVVTNSVHNVYGHNLLVNLRMERVW